MYAHVWQYLLKTIDTVVKNVYNIGEFKKIELNIFLILLISWA